MLRRLDRYILIDLARVGLLTATVLVTVTAFGAAIKPLASDSLLTAGQTAKYIVLAIVPMTQFALPFAAGFAGTLSLHRMTRDNEVMAAAASGVSYFRLLRPVLMTGLALSVVMVGLTQYVIPRFWALLEAEVQADVTRLFQASIQRGEPFAFGDQQIYADRLVVDDDPSDTDADTRLVLFHVAAADLDDDGRIDRDVTAAQAAIDVYRRPGVTYVKLSMVDTVAYDPESGVLAWAERLNSRTIAIPSGLAGDPRQMTQHELLALRRAPDPFPGVVERRLTLARVVEDREVMDRVTSQIETSGVLELVGTGPDRITHRVYATTVGTGVLGADGGPIVVEQVRDGRPVLRIEATGAVLQQREVGPLDDSTFDLVLEDCIVTDLDLPESANRRRGLTFEALLPAGAAAAPDDARLADMPTEALLERARGHRAAGVEILGPFIDDLVREIDGLRDEISARLLKRYAQSATACLLILLGGVLAMWRRDSLPLTVYLWAFLPSILDLMLISSGEHMMREGTIIGGAIVMWSGNAILLAMMLAAYLRLARN